VNALIHVVAVGARTPIGLHAEQSAAAYRAGISGMNDHPFMVDRVGDPMPGALDSRLDPKLLGAERLLALVDTALRDVCAAFAGGHAADDELPVYLGLPENRPGFGAEDVDAVRHGLASIRGLATNLGPVRTFALGHAAGLHALAVAAQQIREGAHGACLVGGVDSYFHPDTMEWLDANRQLAGAESRSAFVPGEGAAFCLLMSAKECERRGFASLAHVDSASIGQELSLIKTQELCFGSGLTVAVQRAVASLRPHEKINAVICDINGERYRSEEWGFVCLRTSQFFDDPTAYWSPADCWGDTGAASGPLFVMLACQAGLRGYSKGRRSLVWASSEGGLRAAAVLTVPTPQS
jgi:3-oxoacyl-[acyl-carrier-protein] synthase-1